MFNHDHMKDTNLFNRLKDWYRELPDKKNILTDYCGFDDTGPFDGNYQ